MSRSHTITRSVYDGTATISRSEVVTAGEDVNLDQNIGASQTDQVVQYAFKFAKLKSFFMVCDQPITVKFLNAASVELTVVLVANQAVVWTLADTTSAWFVDLFVTDITSLKITTGAIGAGGANLQIRSIVDPT